MIMFLKQGRSGHVHHHSPVLCVHSQRSVSILHYGRASDPRTPTPSHPSLVGPQSRKRLTTCSAPTSATVETHEKQAAGANAKKIRVVITGAGIGGLVLAVALLKRGFDVKVLERDVTAIRGEGKYRGPIQVTIWRRTLSGTPYQLFHFLSCILSGTFGWGGIVTSANNATCCLYRPGPTYWFVRTKHTVPFKSSQVLPRQSRACRVPAKLYDLCWDWPKL